MTQDPHDQAAHPTVEMPKPTFAPLLLSLGLVLVAAGVATSIAFVVIGLVLFFLGLFNWVCELLPGQGHEHEPATERPAPIVPRPGTVEELVPGAVGYRFRLPEKIHPVSAGLKGGLVGGVVMTLPALTWGVLQGHGMWFPVNLLAGTLLPGVDEMTPEQLKQFSPLLLAVGVVMHAAMSATIGLAYGVMLPTLPGTDRGHLIAGGVVLPLIWTGISYGLMGVVNPVLQEYVDWYWFAASQFVFGLAAALVVIRSERVYVPPAGPGSRQSEQVALLLLALLPLAGGCTPPGKPVPVDEAAAATDFGKLFAENCTGCHGQDGKYGPAPPLNDPLFLALIPEAEIVKVLTDGRPPTPMPAFAHPKGALTGAQVQALASGLKSAWGQPPAAPPGAPPYLAKEAGDADRGKAVYTTACAGCHGNEGQGGQAGAINDPAFLALVSDQRLRRIIITGRPDLGCPRYDDKTGRPTDFKPLTDQDVTDVAALLASWRNTK